MVSWTVAHSKDRSLATSLSDALDSRGRVNWPPGGAHQCSDGLVRPAASATDQVDDTLKLCVFSSFGKVSVISVALI